MDNVSFATSINNFQQSLAITLTTFLSSLLSFLPRLLASLVILFVGITLSRWVKNVVVHTLEKLRGTAQAEKTPLQSFLKNAEITSKIEVLIGGVVYWILLLIVLQTSMSVLGLSVISTVLNQILLYIPNVFSALLVILFGVLLAGIAETVVKGAVKTIDPRGARVMGTLTSYFVMGIAIMAGISELGIAQQFINTLFTGLVAAFAIAIGLAFGLGSKETVAKIMDEWYMRMKKS
ncbi:hypothetical protein C5B42_00110 [Candidatus Cerribacteria bacterium 'Amazon FNV 2010 28 9']|uniref:Small-conductance mechanosensitive ion channel n=1 Tax=Candidatus Cerribacteria bacterium 'Amazon FNV 2010 28 9' TaxID=2081795 RepID=A0A317JUH4_9BACT|nr:MAG: hypothetical protein C5B42_00110 [Candidatus Cerribacteria bacterium 'Amazon FNV 2010 28 9']